MASQNAWKAFTGKTVVGSTPSLSARFKVMTEQSFCYWLQGFFELSNSNELTTSQVETIKNHLNLVFEHSIDKQYGDKLPEYLNIHGGTKLSKEEAERIQNVVNETILSPEQIEQLELISEISKKSVADYMKKHPGLRPSREAKRFTC